jgi:small subunit ribosomal protein S17
MPKRVLQGTVVSDKTDKTVVVKVERRVHPPGAEEDIRRSKKYHAHDENNKCKVGDVVRIEECAPISKTSAGKCRATLPGLNRPSLNEGSDP